jgi:hypothetical protein
MVFETGDLNKIKHLLQRYGFLNAQSKNTKVDSINVPETIAGILGFFDEEFCADTGLEPN